MARIVIAGVLAGVLIFIGGFVTHMVFGLVGRNMGVLPDEQAAMAPFSNPPPPAGVYGFPEMPKDFGALPVEEQTKVWNEINARYMQGPAALIIVAPPGEEMMGTEVLVKEFVSNVVVGLLLAWIAAQLQGGPGLRWLVTVVIGLAAWVSTMYSYHVWYRFPLPWMTDELYGQLFEAALAGVPIALVVRGPKAAAATTPATV